MTYVEKAAAIVARRPECKDVVAAMLRHREMWSDYYGDSDRDCAHADGRVAAIDDLLEELFAGEDTKAR